MSPNPLFKITAIPALKDNYIWAIHDTQHAVLIDPGEAAPALAFIKQQGLQLESILCTHRHADHIAGIAELCEVYNVPVYGRRHPGTPRVPGNPHITHDLREGDRLELKRFGIEFDIIEIPGHLDDHIAYLTPDLVFCGDVLFGAGCGRNFEGTPAQLHHSLQRLALLPDATRVYCAHEYTAANLRFALSCEPSNAAVKQRITATQLLRAALLPSLPSTIAVEHATNPFLRCQQAEILHTLQQRGLTDNSALGASELGVFTALRTWKNQF